MNFFGEYIAQIRESKNISQRDLAKRAGLSSASISKIESGIVEKLRVETLIALSQALNEPPLNLLLAYQGKPTEVLKKEHSEIEKVLFGVLAKEYTKEELLKFIQEQEG
jgi:transcriptional regulator with XRE-family HTH domain